MQQHGQFWCQSLTEKRHKGEQTLFWSWPGVAQVIVFVQGAGPSVSVKQVVGGRTC
ncbi:hypothetical protein M1D97_00460 [Kushneria sp. AK178]